MADFFLRNILQQWKLDKYRVTRVEIALSFLISSWVLVGPGLEFPHVEKTDRGPVRFQ